MKKLLYILLFVPLALFGQIPPQVGDIGYGGVVFHVDEYVHVVSLDPGPRAQNRNFNGYNGLSGIIQSPEQGQNLVSESINDGYLSSVGTYGEVYPSAALYLNTLSINGYAGWYMPTINELALIRDVFILIDHYLVDESHEMTIHSANQSGVGANAQFYRCSYCFSETTAPQIFPHSGGGGMLDIIAVRSFPLIYGCTNEGALNFDSLATVNDNSCEYQYDLEIQNLEDSISHLISSVNSANDSLTTQINLSSSAVSSLQQALDTWNTVIDLSAGWNMIGYGCPSPIDLAQGLSNHTDIISIVKDNNGNVYMPEFSFNGIGDLTPGFGYQIKVTEAIEGFSLCDWYVNDIPEDNIVSLQEENANFSDSIILLEGNILALQQENISFSDIINSLEEEISFMQEQNTYLQYSLENINSEILDLECVTQGACFFNIEVTDCEYPQPGYNCDGNILEIGNVAFGGIVFYIDETGQHGLVAAFEDLPGTYQWGLFGINIDGADGEHIGTGNQNTLYIMNQQVCLAENGEITAAQAALDYEGGGYSDWYLPSINELIEMYSSLGINGVELVSFSEFNTLPWPSGYWSSTNYSNNEAYIVGFESGISGGNNKNDALYVRPIRSF
jgi:hypothetical protein